MSKLLNIFGAKYKSIVLVALVVLLIVLLIYGSKKVSTWLDSRDRSDTNVTVDESNLSITQNQAEVLADRLETAMNGLGTNSSSVIDTLSALDSSDDFNLLLQTFGRRNNCNYGNWGCDTGNLLDWLEWEFYGIGAVNFWGLAGAIVEQERLEAQLQRLGYSIDN